MYLVFKTEYQAMNLVLGAIGSDAAKDALDFSIEISDRRFPTNAEFLANPLEQVVVDRQPFSLVNIAHRLVDFIFSAICLDAALLAPLRIGPAENVVPGSNSAPIRSQKDVI
jgi:hypothetical protein